MAEKTGAKKTGKIKPIYIILGGMGLALFLFIRKGQQSNLSASQPVQSGGPVYMGANPSGDSGGGGSSPDYSQQFSDLSQQIQALAQGEQTLSDALNQVSQVGQKGNGNVPGGSSDNGPSSNGSNSASSGSTGSTSTSGGTKGGTSSQGTKSFTERQVQYGSTGQDVKQLQNQLGITADGIFGPQTQQAVKNYQAAHGLQVDGIVGPQTWGALLGGNVSISSVAPQTWGSSGSPKHGAGEPTLGMGSQGSAVQQLQQKLGIAADGIFGPQTQQAVRKYQTAHGLQVDGIVGNQTWGSLLGVRAAASPRGTMPTRRVPGHGAPSNSIHDPKARNKLGGK